MQPDASLPLPEDSRRPGKRPTVILVLTPNAMKALASALSASDASGAKTPGWWSLMTGPTSRN